MTRARSGLVRAIAPAMLNCTSSSTTVSANTIRITARNVVMMPQTCPATVMLRKMPKM